MQPQDTPQPNPQQPTPRPAPRADFARPSPGYANRPMPSGGRPEFARPAPTPQFQPQPQVQPPSPTTAYQPTQPVQPIAPQPIAPTRPAFADPAAQPIPQQPQTFQRSGFAQPEAPVRPSPQPDIIDRVASTSIELPQSFSKKPIPKTLIILVVVGLIGLVASFLVKSQNGLFYTIILGLDLIVAAALFLRMELARKAALGMALVTVTMSAALLLSYFGLASNTVNAEAKFVAEAKKLQSQSPTKQLTHDQQQHLDAMQLKLEAQQDGVGATPMFVYGKYGATIVLYAAIVAYLLRPKIKEVFQPAAAAQAVATAPSAGFAPPGN